MGINQKNRKEEGYISFDPDEFQNINQESTPNVEAYKLLWEACCVSSHMTKTKQNSNNIDDDDIYPTSAAETKKMEELVNQAEKAIKTPDSEINSQISELRQIIDWSKSRHWKLNWIVIVGVIVSVFILNMCADDKQGDVKKVNAKIEQIKNWQNENFTIEIEKFKGAKWVYPQNPYATAKIWKENTLQNTAISYYNAIQDIEYNTAELEKHKGDNLKDFYEEQIENNKKKSQKELEYYNKLNNADFEEVTEMALEKVQVELDKKEADAGWVKFWNIFFLILIPIYIFAARPRGYSITRYRREASALGVIEKIGLWLSGGLFAAGAGIGFVDIVTKWSDGSTTRSDDGTGPARLAIKLGLMAAAVLVFCAISCFLMLYATITGLIRNYNWGEIKNKAVETGSKMKKS